MKIRKWMLDELAVPEYIARELTAKYMEYVKEPKPFVMQAHYIGDSQHVDFRFKVNGFLEGWSVHPRERVLVWSSKGIEAPTLEELFSRFKNIEKINGYEMVRPSYYKALAFKGGIGYWVPITAIVRHRYKGKILELDQKWGVIKVTPNHSVYSQECTPAKASSNPEILGIRNISYSPRGDSIKLHARGLFQNGDKVQARRSFIPLPIELRGKQLKAFLYFLGAFIAEGCVHKKTDGSYLVQIGNNNLDFLKRVQQSISDSLGITSWISGPDSNGTYTLGMSNKTLYYYLKNNVGASSLEKRIPPDVLALKKDYLKVLWKSLWEGDGCDKWKSFSTSSEELAIQVCFLLGLFGSNFTVKKSVDPKSRHYIYNILLVDHYHLNKAERKIGEIDFEGYVYDLSLEPLHNFACGLGLVVCHNSIVGGSRDDPHTPQKFLENIGKGFRAETKCVNPFCNEWKYELIKVENGIVYVRWKTEEELSSLTMEELARQPLQWLKVEGKVEPGEVGAGEEAPGEFKILTKGLLITGAQKPYFHEYFIKDNKYFKDWTRIVLRAIKVKKIDPKTKKPIPGEYERMWRFMIPKDQKPYALSKRAIEHKWKPPQNIKYPFPKEWAKKNWPKEFERWELYLRGELSELTTVRFTLGLASWMGPRAKTGRQMPQMRWFLFLDDKGKGKVRTFLLDGYPLKDEIMAAYEYPRTSRKWLDYQGETEPNTPPVNPNKELVGQYVIIDSGTVSYTTRTEDGEEVIELDFKGKRLKGKYQLKQEEKGADVYIFEKLSAQVSMAQGVFVLDKHYWPETSKEYHLDLRFKLPEWDYLKEFNIWEAKGVDDLKKLEVPYPARLKECSDLEWLKVKKTGTRMKAYGKWSIAETIDHGSIEIIEDSPRFMSFNINGKKLKGYYIARKADGLWQFMKSKLPKPLSIFEKMYEIFGKEGDPREGKPYEPFKIEQKRGWNYFIVHIYDLRKFTRVEPSEKTKLYLPELDIPEGVDIGIGLYPRPGKIHGARVAYIIFDSSKWTHEQAIRFIRDKKLDTWEGEQIRSKRK